MNLVVSDALAKEILRLGRSDAKLLRALAAEWIARIDPAVLHPYLLGGGVALDLLADRLKKEPDRTLAELARLEAGKNVATPVPRSAPAPKRSKPAKTKAKAKAKAPLKRGRKGKRVRLSTAQLEQLKAAVVAFLGGHPWATRKQICEAANVPTPSLYNRVVTELRGEKKLVSKGEKAKRVYALAAAAAAKKAAKKKPAKKKPAKNI